MTPDILAQQYRGLAPFQDWLAIIPEMTLGVLALLVLVCELLLPRERKGLLTAIAVVPQVVLLALSAYSALMWPAGTGDSVWFNGMIVQGRTTELLRVFFLLSSVLVCQLGSVVLRKQELPRAEFYVLELVGTASLMLLVQARNFALLFVALETLAICLYVLVAYVRHSALSLEAGLKYLITSGLSSALLLFGIVLLYGAAGNPLLDGSSANPLGFAQLRAFIALNPDNAYAITGAVLVVAALLFKIAAVPFQIWVSDVYQGAPTPVTAFLAVASKAGGFALLINVLGGPLMPLRDILLPLLQVVAVATILFGNLAALGQRNVKRLMGLSGIAHAGYLLVGVCAAYYDPLYVDAVYFYLFMYLLASMGVFAVMAHVSGSDDATQEVEDYSQLLRRSPLLGGVLAISLGSLAGIPPLAGFAAKLLLFVGAFKAGLVQPASEQIWGIATMHLTLAAAILGVVLSIYYYFNWLRESAFIPSVPENAESIEPRPLTLAGFWSRIAMTGLAALTVVFGFWQGLI